MEETSLESARRIFGDGLLGPEEICTALGADPHALQGANADVSFDRVPFPADWLRRAADEGMVLTMRIARLGDALLTLGDLATRFPGEANRASADAWFEREPFAEEACRPGWALFEKRPFAASRNLTYTQQTEALAERAAELRMPLRRRTAVEIVYDTLLHAALRGEHLLVEEWDWSSSATADGAFVTAGQFDERGLHLLRYSEAVRFDGLGVCATIDSNPGTTASDGLPGSRTIPV
jgi:hypothetical protein